MVPRSLLLRRLRASRLVHPHTYQLYSLSSTPKRLNSTVQKREIPASLPSASEASSSSSSSQPPLATEGQQHQKSWLTRQVEASPTAKRAFLGLARVLGYGSPRQLAARRAFVLYEQVCAVTPDQDAAFWKDACYLPPTFQSWFTITNLHVWLLTVRLRALPEPHGKFYIQALIDHFFIDIEDRIRAVLQPKEIPSAPYTFSSPFYLNPNDLQAYKSSEDGGGKVGMAKKVKVRAPDRIVTRQMKIFKEQWAGLGLSLDLAMCTSDQEMAAAIWRNFLGARGAMGIEYPEGDLKEIGKNEQQRKYRRAVNLVGGEVVDVKKIDLEKESVTDDGSGVHDFAPEEVDKYLTYPEVMLGLTRYIRRELSRLEKVSDEDIMNGEWAKLEFGRVKV